MSTFRLEKLNQKLTAILVLSFLIRSALFFLQPNSRSPLTPDEGIYAALAQWTAESKAADEFPAFGANLYLSSRSFILPASAFYRLGFGAIDAVRLTASLYGFLTLSMVLLFILKWIRVKFVDQKLSKGNETLIVVLFAIFAFAPSHFIWSNLGLREAPNEFWVLAGIISVFAIYQLGDQYFVRATFLLFASIVLTFSARPQTGWLVGVTALMYLLTKLKCIKTPFVFGIVVLGVIFGATVAAGTAGTAGTAGATVTEGTAGATVTEGTAGATVTEGTTLTDIPISIFNLTEQFPTKHRNNQLDAASRIETPSCPIEQTAVVNKPPNRIGVYLCILWRAPYMSSTFLFRPFIATDVTSTASLIAALENIIWSIAVLLIVYMIVKRRGIPHFDKLMPSLIFFTLFVIGAGAYEGNMGTAFRHKSLILWVVLATLLALFWRDSQEVQEDSRGKSTENAV